MLIDGATHLAYTYAGIKEAPGSTPAHFVLYGRTQAGLLTVTANDSTMSCTVAPYRYGGLVCASVTFPGAVD